MVSRHANHPGEKRTELTIAQHYYWKGMRTTIKSVCSRCHSCQINKPKLKKLGILPPKSPEDIPWHTLCIDLVGPYKIGKDPKAEKLIHCLTMIDPATGWFEIAPVPTKRTDVIANILEQTWLMRYPWPTKVVLDRGTEFMADVKKLLVDEYGITRKPITTRNPQANAIVERAHQTIHNMIRSHALYDMQPDKAKDLIDGILTAVAFGMRATVHTTSRATPTQLVFGRDAMLNACFWSRRDAQRALPSWLEIYFRSKDTSY